MSHVLPNGYPNLMAFGYKTFGGNDAFPFFKVEAFLPLIVFAGTNFSFTGKTAEFLLKQGFLLTLHMQPALSPLAPATKQTNIPINRFLYHVCNAASGLAHFAREFPGITCYTKALRLAERVTYANCATEKPTEVKRTVRFVQ